MTTEINNDLREKLAELSHKQWLSWAGAIRDTENISKERLDRWESQCFKPYSELSEAMKDEDRILADKVLKILNSELAKRDKEILEKIEKAFIKVGWLSEIEKDAPLNFKTFSSGAWNDLEKIRELFEELEQQLTNNSQIKKDNFDGSNGDYLETQNIAGEDNKLEHMPVSVDNQSDTPQDAEESAMDLALNSGSDKTLPVDLNSETGCRINIQGDVQR